MPCPPLYPIRRAALADAPAIAKLNFETWRTTYRGIVHSEYLDGLRLESELAPVEQRLSNPDLTILVATAEPGGEVVGFVDYGPAREVKRKEIGQLHAIYVLDAHQGRGIGGRLFDAVRLGLREAGYRSFFVSALTLNRRACEFYLARGGRLFEHDCVILDGVRYETDHFEWIFTPER